MHNTPLMFQLDFFNVFYGPVSGLQHICMLWRVKKKKSCVAVFLQPQCDDRLLCFAEGTCQVISSQKSLGGLAADVADLWLSVCSYVSTRCSVAATLPLLASFLCFFQALQSQSRERRWTNDNVFGASEVTDIYCRQRSKVEIKKSFNKERITFPLIISRKEFKWGSTEKRFA